MNTMPNSIKDAVHYDPITGKFTWLPGQRYAGKEAGSLHNILGYVRITLKGKSVYAHRLAWFIVHGHWPEYIDHINGVRNDNRIVNLREVPKQVNHKNMKCYSSSSTKVTGVCWHKQSSKWRAYITLDKKQAPLGCFDSFEDAVQARKDAEVLHQYHANHGRQHQ